MLLLPVIYTTFCYIYFVTAGNFSISSRRSKRGVYGTWGYTEQNGPLTWGGICQTGMRQSPINIELGSVIVKDFPAFNFGKHYLSKHKFNAINNGHTIYVALEDSSIKPVIFGGGLGDKFIFEQLHLHWESEHEFEGRRADLEMHLVHYNAKYGSFAEASAEPDGLCVLAVIFKRSNETDGLYQSFFDYILQPSVLGGHSSHVAVPGNSIPGNENGEEKLGFFALRDFLPKHVSRFFTYKGSLTTPDCTENVLWTVFINRISVASEVLILLKTIKDHDGNALSQNFRPPKNLNGRQVYIHIRDYEAKYNTHSGSNINTVLPTYVITTYIIVYWHFLL